MLRSIDRELFQLVGSVSVSDESVKELIENGTTLPVHKNSVELLGGLLEGGFSDDAISKFIDKISTKATTDVVSDMEMIYDTLNLESSIDKNALYGLEYYGISDFRYAVIYLLTLMDHSVLMQEKIDLKSVLTLCHPIGFYTTNTCDVIIEKLLNNNMVEQAHLYHKALELRH